VPQSCQLLARRRRDGTRPLQPQGLDSEALQLQRRSVLHILLSGSEAQIEMVKSPENLSALCWLNQGVAAM